MMQPLRILYVSACLPIANGTGSQKRSFVAAHALQQLGAVHFLEVPPGPGTSATDEGSGLFAARLAGSDMVADDPGCWSSYFEPSFTRKLLQRAWITAGAMLPLLPEQNKALLASITRRFGAQKFDLIYIFQAHAGLFMCDALDELLAADGVSLIDWDAAERPAAVEQYRAREHGKGVLSWLGCRLNDCKLARYERRLLDAVDLTVCASDYDVAYFKARRPSGSVHAIPNCIDVPAQATAASTADVPTVLFVGLLNYWPNRSGVLLFLSEIWPQVRATFPDAVFNIVGRGVTPDISAWHGREGVNVIGEVEHVAPHYAACHVAVAPMFFSVGSSIKILEALAFNRALVAFETATRRHALIDGISVSVARSSIEFSGKLVALLADPESASVLAFQGREKVSAAYARENVEELTVDIIKQKLYLSRN